MILLSNVQINGAKNTFQFTLKVQIGLVVTVRAPVCLMQIIFKFKLYFLLKMLTLLTGTKYLGKNIQSPNDQKHEFDFIQKMVKINYNFRF